VRPGFRRGCVVGVATLLAVGSLGGCGESVEVASGGGPDFDLVFYSDRSGEGDLFLLRADDFRTGSFNPIRLMGTGFPDYGPRWVPEGPGLVFITEVEVPGALYAIAPRGEGMATRLGPNPATDEPPAFTPDGTRMVFAAATEEGIDLFSSDLAGGDVRRITSDGLRKVQPAVSPDGERVVYGVGPDGAQKLALVGLDGSGGRTLTDGPSNDGHPYWLPDGSGLVFDSNRVGVGTDIFHLDLESGSLRNLTNDRGIDLVPSVSPDGRWVAFGSSRSGNWDLFLVPFEGGAARQLTASPTFEGDARWLPAGVMELPDPPRDAGVPSR
jgi:Tol biopolymer transport system component